METKMKTFEEFKIENLNEIKGGTSITSRLYLVGPAEDEVAIYDEFCEA